MAAEDWLPPGFDCYDMPDRDDVECRYCGETGFSWLETRAGWRLVDGRGVRHNCLEVERMQFEPIPEGE